METFHHDIIQVKIVNQLAWLMTITFVILIFPLFKTAIVFALEKLYDLFILKGILK